jgi:hypothetical protein
VSLEKRETPFKGTVKLYANKGCKNLIGLGVPDTTLEVTEKICSNDKVLDLIPAGFRSYTFDLPGNHIDTTGAHPKERNVFVAITYYKPGCKRADGGQDFKPLSQIDKSTGCVDLKGDKLGHSFLFARVRVSDKQALSQTSACLDPDERTNR